MNIYLNIEKLIAYAKIHLLLDEADEIYVRNALLRTLGLAEGKIYEVDEEEIEGMENPFAILTELYAYACEKGDKRDERLFDAEIMDIVSLRPGEMEDMFDSLSANPVKALDWVFDYAIKNGSARNDFARWENKGDKNLEVVFGEGCCHGESCCKCVENEGRGVFSADRFIQLPIKGDWYLRAAKKAFVDGMCLIVAREHRPSAVNKSAIDTMFDFIEMAPSRYIHTGDCEENKSHAFFVTTSRPLPINKSADKNKFKSKEYPYIGIVETDWYDTTIKLSCTNREKLTELTCKVINAYKGKVKDGKLFVSVYKVESKFVIEMAFISGEAKKEHSGLSPLNLMSMAGVFRIDGKVENELKTIEKYLTKELRFTPTCLTGGMENHAKMIDNLLKDVGTNKLGAVEAALDVKEECKKTLAAFLSDVSAFGGASELLDELDISVVK